MSARYLRPHLLQPDDLLDEFECRSVKPTFWLRDHARQAHATGTVKALVVVEQDSQAVVAYYAWAMASITVGDAPARVRKGAGRYPQPGALLARLGDDLEHERRGLGAAILQDVVSRVAELGAQIGCRGLLVHAESEEARILYLRLIPGFERSPTDPQHLLLLLNDLRQTLRRRM